MSEIKKRRNLVSLIRKGLRILLLSYLGAILLVYFTQEKLIFYPSKLPQDFKFALKLKFKEHFTELADARVHSLIVTPENSRAVILYFHGNGGAMDMWSETAEELAMKTNCDVWMVDYPGYGKSTGTVTSQNQLLTMAEKILAELKQEYPGTKIILYGRSLGSGLAANLTTDSTITALILESPYYSLTHVAKSMFPYLPSVIMKYPMPSYQWIAQAHLPILMVHGNKDEIVPFQQGKALSKVAKDSTFVEIEGGHHNDLHTFPEYWKAVTDFIERVLKPANVKE